MIAQLLLTNVVIWLIFLVLANIFSKSIDKNNPIAIVIFAVPAVYLLISTPIYIVLAIWGII